MDLKLNASLAKEANSGGKRITEPGDYVGVIRQAWFEENERGTKSVHISFAADNGQEAGPLPLYIYNSEGKELPSLKTLNAILACLRLRDAKSRPGKVTVWDYDQGAEVQRDKAIYPELIGKRIGLVLQGEEYMTSKGEQRMRLLIAAPFEFDTRRMAAEVLDQSPDATALDRFLKWFEDHKVKQAGGQRKPAQKPVPAGSYDDFSDDIPF